MLFNCSSIRLFLGTSRYLKGTYCANVNIYEFWKKKNIRRGPVVSLKYNLGNSKQHLKVFPFTYSKSQKT